MKTRFLKLIQTFILLIFISIQCYSQKDLISNNNLAVSNTIIKLFDGMREVDSSKVRSVFRDDVRMFTSFKTKSGENMLKEGELIDFLNAIGSPHPEIWDEKIWNTIIQIDGNLAQVWTDYAFYVGEKFSHCGVDAFQLIKEENENWKIINLIDTRRIEGCKLME